MAVNRSFSQPKQSAITRLLPLIGAGVGAAYGGPAGAGLGMQAGGMLGGLMTPPPEEQRAPVQPDSSAIQRRMSAANEDSMHVLKQGAMALTDPSVPQEVRDQYAEPILTAFQLEKQMRQKKAQEGVA